MKIKFIGQASINKTMNNIKSAIADIQERAGLPAGKVFIEDIECKVAFDINGKKEYIAVTHEGINELFTVLAQLDEKGNLMTAKDNTEESFLDKFHRAITKGQEVEYEVIESVFADTELIELSDSTEGGITEKLYSHIATGDKVTRYYKDGALIGELVTKGTTKGNN